jgi:hypothetical protein
MRDRASRVALILIVTSPLVCNVLARNVGARAFYGRDGFIVIAHGFELPGT